ncbi:hypothetical protein H6P81_017382 [Aristolochia fimbriata]|uniref:Uncharacterized protein n=1 Tax=Aristolochia fimbriata TaxID=158543 RepID=A0AAV7E2B2_ARIFI|nr:hypothetical protein H6P81_017382 [Aristolochia fimbriata]
MAGRLFLFYFFPFVDLYLFLHDAFPDASHYPLVACRDDQPGWTSMVYQIFDGSLELLINVMVIRSSHLSVYLSDLTIIQSWMAWVSLEGVMIHLIPTQWEGEGRLEGGEPEGGEPEGGARGRDNKGGEGRGSTDFPLLCVSIFDSQQVYMYMSYKSVQIIEVLPIIRSIRPISDSILTILNPQQWQTPLPLLLPSPLFYPLFLFLQQHCRPLCFPLPVVLCMITGWTHRSLRFLQVRSIRSSTAQFDNKTLWVLTRLDLPLG